MYPAINNRPAYRLLMAFGLVAMSIIALVVYTRLNHYQTFGVVFYTTRSSDGERSSAPFMALVVAMIATGWVTAIAGWVIARVRVPDQPHREQWMIRDERLQIRSRLAIYIISLVVIFGFMAAVLTHLFA